MLVTREQGEGDSYFNKHSYSEAIGHYVKMLDASRKLGIYRNRPMESEVCRKIASGYEMLGSYEAALRYISQAAELDSAENNIPGIIEDFRHRGNIEVYMGSYYSGLASFGKAIKLATGAEQSLKNSPRLLSAEICLSLAQTYAVMGRSQSALTYCNRALAIFRDIQDARGEMESLLVLATVFSDQGDILTTRKFISNSLKIAEDKNFGKARHYQLMASLELSEGSYENALRLQEMAINEAERLGIAAQVIWADIGMGDIYAELGDMKQAERYYNLARNAKAVSSLSSGSLSASIDMRSGDIYNADRFYSAQGSVQGRAISSLRLAELMISENKTDSALSCLRQSAEGFRATRNTEGLANSQLMLGDIFSLKGENLSADLVLDSALSVSRLPEIEWKAWFRKGKIYEKSGRDDKAIVAFRKAVNVLERIRGNLTIDELKSTFFGSKREVYDRLINLLQKNGQMEDAFSVSEQDRARAFYDQLANRKIDFRGSLPGDLVSKEQQKRMEMQKLAGLIRKSEASDTANDLRLRSEIKNLKKELENDQSEYENILKSLKLNNPSYSEMVSPQPVSISDLQKKLDPYSASLVYWISDNRIIMWLVNSTGVTGASVNIDSRSLSHLVEQTRNAIESNSTELSDSGLKQLYQYLIQPFEERLSGIKNLIVIPNGALHFIPFQALRDLNGVYLVEQFNIIYAPSAGIYILCHDRPVVKGSEFMGLALADVSLSGRQGLPGTADELKKILTLFPKGLSAFGSECTETFAKKNAARYDFIHFATHGSYNFNQPLYSCLLFPQGPDDDGRLNVYEVLEMKLNAKLVTLSACETGLGNIDQGDELIGLSRSFLFAGSSAVIVSLWAVADYPTSMLMSSFYSYLKTHSAEEALTLAQRDILKVYPQPLYWSPFILIGNGTVTAD
jgi:CHAT domain-containing protein/predicted negative regulator of RcsB-dependent stress response